MKATVFGIFQDPGQTQDNFNFGPSLLKGEMHKKAYKHIQTASKKEALAESFIKIGWKLKKRQPNVLISLLMHFPF